MFGGILAQYFWLVNGGNARRFVRNLAEGGHGNGLTQRIRWMGAPLREFCFKTPPKNKISHVATEKYTTHECDK